MPTNYLAPEKSIANRLYETLVPVNARTLIDTVRGETAPITEKNFTQEELDVLRRMHAQRTQYNENWRQQLSNDLALTRKDYEKNPEKTSVWDQQTGIVTLSPVPYDDFIRDRTAQLASFDRTKGKTSLTYNDYPDKKAAPTFDSWLSSIWKSYTDPGYRMKTVLGSFNVLDTPEGRRALDQYNFDAADYYRTFKKVDPATAPVSELWRKANGPVDFLDMLMIKKFPKTSRAINIKLD